MDHRALGFSGFVHRSGSDGFQGRDAVRGICSARRSPRMKGQSHPLAVKVPGPVVTASRSKVEKSVPCIASATIGARRSA